MEEIEYNIKLRKLYSSKLCEFYNYIKEKIDNKSQFHFNVQEVLHEENQIWEKWQSKVHKMQSFDKEIGTMLNKQNPFDDTKKREIEYLKNSFEKQIQDAYNHYMIFFKRLEKNRNSWLNAIIYEYIAYSNKQKYLIELSTKIQDAYPQFKSLCDSWNTGSIEKAQETLFYISEIEMFCQKMLHEFDNLNTSTVNMNNPASQNQINILASQCEQLSELLEKFLNNFNIMDLLNKLKTEDSILFKNEFSELFGSNGFGKIRSTIKLVYDTDATKNRIHVVYQTFKNLQLIIHPEMQKLQDKKYKLLTLCCNASEINRLSTEKWVIDSYSVIFNPIDLIIEKRSKLINI